jgi:flagellar hook-associated protein 3 FlgL
MSIRLNPNPIPDLLAALQENQQNLNTAMQELSSGRAINQLSDNPAAAASLVRNHDQSSQDAQYVQNIGTLQSRFQLADSTLSDVTTALTRAITLGTQGANGTENATDRQAIAAEVQGIQAQVTSLANTSFQGSFIFAGTAVTTQPFTIDPTSGAATYNGNTGVASVQVSSGELIQANVPGSQLFLNSSGSVFTALQDLNASLQSGNNIGAAVTEVQQALNTIDTQRVFYGNALTQISTAENDLNRDTVTLSQRQNSLVGVDPNVAASNLVQAQTANEELLSAASRTLGLPNLLDFLPLA